MFMTLGALAYTVYDTIDNKEAFDSIPTNQTVYNVQTEIPQEVLWTGSQIVGKLYRLTEEAYPIQVGTLVFTTDEDVSDYQHLISLTASYKETIQIDTEGKPSGLLFEIQ